MYRADCGRRGVLGDRPARVVDHDRSVQKRSVEGGTHRAVSQRSMSWSSIAESRSRSSLGEPARAPIRQLGHTCGNDFDRNEARQCGQAHAVGDEIGYRGSITGDKRVNLSPCSTRRMISPLSLRSSRWLIVVSIQQL